MLQVVPLFVGLTFFIIVLFIIQTGNKNKTWTPAVGDGKAVWISVIPAVGFWVITQFLIMPYLKKVVLAEEAAEVRYSLLIILFIVLLLCAQGHLAILDETLPSKIPPHTILMNVEIAPSTWPWLADQSVVSVSASSNSAAQIAS